MFNLFIDDPGTMLQHSGKGLSLGKMKFSCLFYADDLILIAETEEVLIFYLYGVTETWCEKLRLCIIETNQSKIQLS